MTATPPFQDLTDALITARQGLRKHVQVLVDQLPAGGFYLALGRSLGLPEETVAPMEAPLSSHMAKHPEGNYYVTLFTRSDLAKAAANQAGWKTDDGPIETVPVAARNALYYALKLIANNDNVDGLLINPYHETGVQLGGYEVQCLFEYKAIPWVGYAFSTPMGPEESMEARPADMSSAPDFTEAVQAYIATRPYITGYDMVALFNDQRDIEPYLAINLHTTKPESDYPEIAQTLMNGLQGKVPAPGYIEVLFNQEFSGVF
jgi:hypothetical protein